MDEFSQSQPASQPILEPPPAKKPWGKIISLIVIIVLVVSAAAALVFWRGRQTSTSPAKSQTQTQPQSQSQWLPLPQEPTSTLPSVELVNATPQIKETNLPLAQILNYKALLKKYGLKPSAEQEQFLGQNHFLLVPSDSTNFSPSYNFDDMLADFDTLGGQPQATLRKPEDTKFVTPDIMLEAYHKFFDLTLKQLEQTDLTADLDNFLNVLTGNLLAAEQNSSGYPQQRYQNVLAQMTVARVLFEDKSPAKPPYFNSPDEENSYNAADQTIDSVANAKIIAAKYTAGLTPDLVSKINQELDLIYAEKSVQASPLFGQYSSVAQADYTQYTPRSHYTENSTLRAYFRTMMYLGRNSYLFQSDDGLADANLLTKQMSMTGSDGSAPLQPWQKIMAVTGFYAGQSDDVTYTQWRQYLASTLGAAPSDADLTTSANITKLAQNLNQLPQPKILSSVIVDPTIFSQTKADLLRNSLGLRVFGQRFTFDAWVLNDLTAGQELTDTKLPSTPSALFIPAAFGDPQARQYSQTFLKTDAGFSDADVRGFLGKLDQKQSDIAKVSANEWFNSMGSTWLYVLGSLTQNYGQGYPMYMQNSMFLDKQLETYLGSYAELKHDTLLYAKQSYAERGGGGDDATPPPIVKGFVEPNMEFWNRFNQLLARTQQLFTDNNLFADNSATSRLQQFQGYSTFLTGLAKKELENQSISDDEYEQLRNLSLSFMAQPFDGSSADENTGKVALVADVHTDAVKQQILYEATGKPYLMLAIVGNENAPRMVASLVYNHYEFTNPLQTRLSDQDWQKWVYEQPGQLPPKNFWYQSLGVK